MIVGKQSESGAYKSLGISMIVSAIIMGILALLLYTPKKGWVVLDYNYTNESLKIIFLLILGLGFILGVYGIVILIFKLRYRLVKVTALGYTIICICVANIFTHYDFLLTFMVPAIATQLFFDKRLSYFTEITTIIGFTISVIVSGFILDIYPLSGNDFVADFVKLYIPNVILMGLFSLLFNSLSEKTSFMKELSYKKSKTLNSQNDALDTLIQSSIDLFTKTNTDDLNKTIKSTCLSVTDAFIDPDYRKKQTTNGEKITNIITGMLRKSNDGRERWDCTDLEDRSIRPILLQSDIEINTNGKTFKFPSICPIVEDISYDENGNRILDEKSDDDDKKFEFLYTFNYDKDPAKVENNNYILISIFTRVRDSGTRALKLINFIIIDTVVVMNDTLNEIMKIMSNNIGVALMNLKLSVDLTETQRELIKQFSIITDSRSGDPHTEQHVVRVSKYMEVLCKAAGFSKKASEKIGLAAMMHDIGKIYIPTEILEKRGNLTDKERKIVEQHVVLGANLLKNCPSEIMRYAEIMVSEHHERWDGTGYKGIKGPDINPISRLIAIADVFDALISARPYKEGWPKDKVRNQIVSESGTHFDPQCVGIFLRHFDELVEIYEANSNKTENTK